MCHLVWSLWSVCAPCFILKTDSLKQRVITVSLSLNSKGNGIGAQIDLARDTVKNWGDSSALKSPSRRGQSHNSTLWLIHTARDRDQDSYRDRDGHNRKQWFPLLSLCSVYSRLRNIEAHHFLVHVPVPVPCSVNELLLLFVVY